MTDRAELIDDVAAHLIGKRRDRPLRVAVDGVTAAGKTMFAAELVAAIGRRGVPVVKLSTDDFHHRSEHRHRDPDQARGYYRDAYDLAGFRRLVLEPLGRLGDRNYVPRLHDLASDELLDEPSQLAPPDAIVVVEGSFLQSAELAGSWDEVVYIDTSFAEAVERAVPRDTTLFGDEAAVRVAYGNRYHAACRLYLEDVNPIDGATIVIDNNVIDRPAIVRLLADPAAASAL